MKEAKLKIKRELDTVYIDSSGGKHIKYKDALSAEGQIQSTKAYKRDIKNRIMKITELIMQVLKSEKKAAIKNKQ